MDFLTLIGIGISAFIATNIDDLVVLVVFFAQALLPSRQVVLGQYVGFSTLVAISVAGSLVSLVVPVWIVGLMGFLPIGIGIKKLLKKEDEEEIDEAKEKLEKDNTRISSQWRLLRLQTEATTSEYTFRYLPRALLAKLLELSVFSWLCWRSGAALPSILSITVFYQSE